MVSQNTLDRVMGSFTTEPLGEFALKGLKQKMPVHAVLGTERSGNLTTPPPLPIATNAG